MSTVSCPTRSRVLCKLGTIDSTAASSRSTTSSSTINTKQATAVDLKIQEFSKASASAAAAVATQSPPPVLLLHGLLGSKRNFSTIGKALATQLHRERRIIGVDLRNHGDNTHDVRKEMTLFDMAHDVLHVMNKHGLNKVVLVGHSVGGKVAQTLALLYPDRVDGLVVLDIAPVKYSTSEPHWQAIQDIVNTLVHVPNGLTRAQVDAHLQQAVPDPALRAFLLTNYSRDSWKIPMDIIQDQLSTLADFDVSPSPSAASQSHSHSTSSSLQYNGDVFFIHGGQSRFVRHSHMESISTYFPNHMLTTIRGAGHWVHAEAPDATVALLKKYLDR